MKFSIRHADKIVGFFIILALAILILVFFLIGSNQRWFARDVQYRTYFSSASGISANMAILYKGFTIGHVKKVNLVKNYEYNDETIYGDFVEITFTIFEEYVERVKEGSLVELQSSPIPGLGGGFIFHPGNGPGDINPNEIIPEINSQEGKQIKQDGTANVSASSDSINNIINQANTLLDTLNVSLSGARGSEHLLLGQILINIEQVTKSLTALSDTITGHIDPILAQVNPVLEQLNQLAPIIDNIETITNDIGLVTSALADPSGTVMSIINIDSSLYSSLKETMDSLAGTVNNLEKTTDFLPSQLPVLVSQINTVLRSAQDVIVALMNNPLLKGGIPARTEAGPGGASPWNLDF